MLTPFFMHVFQQITTSASVKKFLIFGRSEAPPGFPFLRGERHGPAWGIPAAPPSVLASDPSPLWEATQCASRCAGIEASWPRFLTFFVSRLESIPCCSGNKCVVLGNP